MNQRSVFITSLSAVFLVSVFCLAENVNLDTRTVAGQMGAGSVTQFSFSSGSSTVSSSAKSDLAVLVKDARKRGTIAEVRVATWADKEYPAEGAKLSDAQVRLAERRSENVSAYLKQQFGLKDFSNLNMAKRPNALQQALGTKVAENKNAMENSGASPTRREDTGLFGLRSKASQAVVMVYYK